MFSLSALLEEWTPLGKQAAYMSSGIRRNGSCVKFHVMHFIAFDVGPGWQLTGPCVVGRMDMG